MAKKKRTKNANSREAAPAGNPMLSQVGPDFYDDAALADALLGDAAPATIADVRRMRAEGRILALATADEQWIHPTWQVHDGDLLPGLPQVIAAFTGHPAWSVALWLTSKHEALGGITPVEALGAPGSPAAVVALAEQTAERWAT